MLSFAQTTKAQNCAPIAAADLRRMLVELGYEVKDANTTVDKEKYEISILSGGLNVPIRLELSGSKGYIWLTAYLGKTFADSSPKNWALLKRNAVIQPSQFYVTEAGNLMMALPVENRGVTNVTLRKATEMLSTRVSENKLYWQQTP